MPVEIERKFLVNPVQWASIEKPVGDFYAQGYLCSDKDRTVRVRITPSAAFLTIKGRPAPGELGRPEYEYEIPISEAREMLAGLCESSLEKTRFKIPFGRHVWEVDVFAGANAPLILAEIELGAENEEFAIPDWIAQERTADFRFSNSYLAKHPFSTWGIG